MYALIIHAKMNVPTSTSPKFCVVCGKNKIRLGNAKYCKPCKKSGKAITWFVRNNPDRIQARDTKKREKWLRDTNNPENIKHWLKQRFLVLYRDNFTCQYCGRSAPEVPLHVDHVIPKSQGGTNAMDNLKTACKDCNLGKYDILLAQHYGK